MKTLLAIAAIFVLTGLGWFAWLNIDQEGYNSGILDNPPVIKAVDNRKILEVGKSLIKTGVFLIVAQMFLKI